MLIANKLFGVPEALNTPKKHRPKPKIGKKPKRNQTKKDRQNKFMSPKLLPS